MRMLHGRRLGNPHWQLERRGRRDPAGDVELPTDFIGESVHEIYPKPPKGWRRCPKTHKGGVDRPPNSREA